MDEESFHSQNVDTNSVIVGQSTAFKWLKLIGINLLAFGLELCASAGFCYIPPIMLKKGFSESALTIIMGIGPFISLLLVPMIGYWSDHCESQFGRRRPFIFALGLLILLSLLMIPFSQEIASFFGIIGDAYALAVGVVLLDFSTQAVMNPCKALIPDIFRTTEEQNSGFTAYSFMLSMGGGIGYLISSVNWADTTLGVTLGSQEKAVFCVLAIFFTFLLMMNLSLAKEVPFENTSQLFTSISDNPDYGDKEPVYTNIVNGSFLTGISSLHKSHLSNTNCYSKDYLRGFGSFLQCFKCRSVWYHAKSSAKSIYFLLSIPLKLLLTVKLNFLYFLNMPPLLAYLFVSCLFGWMGIMCHDSYYTDFVGQVIYQGKPKADDESVALNLYNQGVRMGSWGLLLHCLSAAIYSAFIQHRLVIRIGQRRTYLSGITIFSLSLIGTVQTNSLILVNIFTALSGAGYIALSTVPYSLITVYHNSKQICEDNKDRGIGEDMAVLDSAYYLSQIIPSLFLGYIVDLTGSPSTYMIVAALCGAAASYFSFFIKFPPKSFVYG